MFKFTRSKFAAVLAGITLLASCKSETDFAVGSGTPTFGALSATDMSAYFYPRTRGMLYVYHNQIASWDNGLSAAPIIYNGANDSLVTLGALGLNQYGDSVYGCEVRYRVKLSSAGRSSIDLRYLPNVGSTLGAFIDSSTTLAGEITPTSPPAMAVCADMVMGAVAGRAKSLIDDFSGNVNTIWQKDTIYFTSGGDTVTLWQKSGTTYQKIQHFATANFVLSQPWTLGVTESSTSLTLMSEDNPLTTQAGTFSSIRLMASTPSLQLPLEEDRYYSASTGLVKQSSSWWTTTNGVNRIKKQYNREINVVVTDWDEVN